MKEEILQKYLSPDAVDHYLAKLLIMHYENIVPDEMVLDAAGRVFEKVKANIGLVSSDDPSDEPRPEL